MKKGIIVLICLSLLPLMASCGGGGSSSSDEGGPVNTSPVAQFIPDTGQTISYTDTFGEDPDYAINPPHYTKLDASGNDLPDSAMNWTMARDDVTGLIWEVKTEDGGIHDKGNTYTRQEALNAFIAQLNSDNFGDRSDWRLPTIRELSALVHADAFSPAINAAYFPQTMPTEYWSSTTDVEYPDYYEWGMDFYYGTAGVYDKLVSYYVRAVSGEQSISHFVDNGDGTVTDSATGLMWQRAEAGRMTWEAALTYCEKLSLAAHDDWRLPNRNELHSIVDYEKNNPSIDTIYFPSAVPDRYWSSTSEADDTHLAWYVGFIFGLVRSDNKSDVNYVRAVRGGQ